MPWLAIVAFVVFVIVVYYFWHSQNEGVGAPPSEDNVAQTFDYEEQDGAAALVRRKLRVVVPAQKGKGKPQKVRIDLKRLPALDSLKPPPEKHIDALLAVVINPVIFASESGEQLTTFDPPLTITIHYEEQDAALTTNSSDGVPQLSIVTVYESSDGWRFEKLQTTVSPNPNGNGGTLTAQVTTLEPDDPFCMGMP
ncbi:MAG: hypothetical protein HY741_22265 [Chloroflexi bacterium]|nr:hypothetical protein [Chloroflexota bacterium]